MCDSSITCTPGASSIVTSDKLGIGYCRKGTDGCPHEYKYSNRNCHIPSKWDASFKTFGANYNEDGIPMTRFGGSGGGFPLD